MKQLLSWALLTALYPSLLLAAENEGRQPLRWQITPYLGYGSEIQFDGQDDSGNASADAGSLFGLSIGKETADPGLIEVLFSHQKSNLSPSQGADLNISYLHFAGALIFENSLRPYVGAGIGLSHFSAYDSTTRPSLALALGLQPRLGEHLALRAEIRGYGTFISDNSSFICDPKLCNLYLQGDMVTQAQANLGLTFRF